MSNNIFYINSSQLEGRLAPEFYRPEIMVLEEKVRSQSTKRLRHYIERVASGATPSVKEEDKFYSDAENGIPFLRVQNLQPNCRLSLGNVRYINRDTHENMLRRSQVDENDLLVKITGVGRMAIASVAPRGFVGNTNQHMVVIKTQDAETSEYLANYLNLDIIEKLASRRSTGGTRPALDYPALKSIPIIEGLDFTLIKNAEEQKQQKDAEAKALLDGIDDYILGELGIILPKEKDNIKLCFITNFSEVSESRIDPHYSKPFFKQAFGKLRESTYPLSTLRDITVKITSGITPLSGGDSYVTMGDGVAFVRSGNINVDGDLDFENLLYLRSDIHNNKMKSSQLRKGDILIAIVGATIGQVGIYNYDYKANINQAIALVRLKDGISKEYIKEVISSSIGQLNLNRLKRPVARANINLDEISTMILPMPPLKIQVEIVKQISEIRAKAKQLQQEGNDILKKAKFEVERMIIE